MVHGDQRVCAREGADVRWVAVFEGGLVPHWRCEVCPEGVRRAGLEEVFGEELLDVTGFGKLEGSDLSRWSVLEEGEGVYIATPREVVRPPVAFGWLVGVPDLVNLALVSGNRWKTHRGTTTGSLLDLDGGHLPSGVSKAVTAFLVDEFVEAYLSALYSYRQEVLRGARRDRSVGYVQEVREVRVGCEALGSVQVVDPVTVADQVAHQLVAALVTATPWTVRKLGPIAGSVYWNRRLRDIRKLIGKWVWVFHCCRGPDPALQRAGSVVVSPAHGLQRWRLASEGFTRTLVPDWPFYGVGRLVELMQLSSVRIPAGPPLTKGLFRYSVWLRRVPDRFDGQCGAMLVFLDWMGRTLADILDEKARLNMDLDGQMGEVHEQRSQPPELRKRMGLPFVDPARWKRRSMGTMARLRTVVEQQAGWSAFVMKFATVGFLEYQYPEAGNGRSSTPGELATQQLVDASGGGHEAYEHVIVRIEDGFWHLGGSPERIARLVHEPNGTRRLLVSYELLLAEPDLVNLGIACTSGWSQPRYTLTVRAIDLTGRAMPLGVVHAVTAFLVGGLRSRFERVLGSMSSHSQRRETRERAAAYGRQGASIRRAAYQVEDELKSKGIDRVVSADPDSETDFKWHQALGRSSTGTPGVRLVYGPVDEEVHWLRLLREDCQEASRWVWVLNCRGSATSPDSPDSWTPWTAAGKLMCRRRIRFQSWGEYVPDLSFYSLPSLEYLLDPQGMESDKLLAEAERVIRYEVYLRRTPLWTPFATGAMLVFLDWVCRGIRSSMLEISRQADVMGQHTCLAHEANRAGPTPVPSAEYSVSHARVVSRSARWADPTLLRVTKDLAQWRVLGRSVISWFFLEGKGRVWDASDRGRSGGELAAVQLSPSSGGGYQEYEHSYREATDLPARLRIGAEEQLLAAYELLFTEPDLVNLAVACTSRWGSPRVTGTLKRLDLTGRVIPMGVVRSVTEFLVNGLANRYSQVLERMVTYENRRRSKCRAAAYASQGNRTTHLVNQVNAEPKDWPSRLPLAVDERSQTDFVWNWGLGIRTTGTPIDRRMYGPYDEGEHWLRLLREDCHDAAAWVWVVNCRRRIVEENQARSRSAATSAEGLLRWRQVRFRAVNPPVPNLAFYSVLNLEGFLTRRGSGARGNDQGVARAIGYHVFLRRTAPGPQGMLAAMMVFVDWLCGELRSRIAGLVRVSDAAERQSALVWEERRTGPAVRARLGLPVAGVATLKRSLKRRDEEISRASAELAQWCFLGKNVVSWFFLEFVDRGSEDTTRRWSDGEVAAAQLSPDSGSGYQEYEHAHPGGSPGAGSLVERLAQAARDRVDAGEYLFESRGLWLPPSGDRSLDLPTSPGSDPVEAYLEHDIWVTSFGLSDAYRKACFRAVARADIQSIVVSLYWTMRCSLGMGRRPDVQMNRHMELVLEARVDAETRLRSAMAEYRNALARHKQTRRTLKWYRLTAQDPPTAWIAGGLRCRALERVLEVVRQQSPRLQLAKIDRVSNKALRDEVWIPGWWVATTDGSAREDLGLGAAALVPKQGYSGPTVVYFWDAGRVSSGTMEGAGICGVLHHCLEYLDQRGGNEVGRPSAGSSSDAPGEWSYDEWVKGLDVQTDSSYSVKRWNGLAPAEWLVPLWDLIFYYRGRLESYGVRVELNWHRRRSNDSSKLVDRVATAAVRRGAAYGASEFPTAILRRIVEARVIYRRLELQGVVKPAPRYG